MKKNYSMFLILFFVLSFCKNSSFGFKPDNEGFIKNWLVVGPFPKEGLWPVCKGYFKDFLEKEGGEINIEPYSKMSHKTVFIPSKMPPVQIQAQQGVKLTLGWEIKEDIRKDIQWTPVSFSSADKKCDFKEMKYFMQEYVVGYAACYIEMKNEKKLKLKIGSDDGFKAWINHKFIGGVHKHRAAKQDEDVFEVVLNKGINILLVKLEQDWAGWDLILRFTEMDDKPFTDYEIYTTRPDFSVVDKITKPEKINILDKDVAGFLSWENTEDNILFPGENKGTLKLASSNSVDASVFVSITDEKKQKVCSKESNVKLSPNNESEISFSVNFPVSGVYNFNAVVKDKNKNNEIANLKKIINILDSQKVYKDFTELQGKTEDLEQEISDKNEEMKNEEYIVDLKEKIIDGKNEKIDSQLKELIKFKEAGK